MPPTPFGMRRLREWVHSRARMRFGACGTTGVSSYEEWEMELDEVLGFGHGIVFAARHEAARPIGGEGYVKSRGVYVYEWIDGMIARVWYYPDIDEARVVAEHLAEERG